MRRFGIIICLLCLYSVMYGQNKKDAFTNSEMERISTPASKKGWVRLKPDMEFNPITLFQDHAAAFGLGSNDHMKLRKTITDDLGFTHYRFYQYNKGVRVEHAEYITHVNKEGKVYSANGKMVLGLDKNPIPALSEAAALEIVLASVGAERYMWQDEFWENELKEHSNNPDTSYFPKGELVWSKGYADTPWEPENFRLAWTFDILSASPHKEQRMVLDANTGQVINVIPLESNCDPTTVTTIFNGVQSINTDHIPIIDIYRLKDSCQTAPIRVRDWNNTTNNPTTPQEITSSTNHNWDESDQNRQFGGSVLWAAKRAYYYFLNIHGRAAYDNANGSTEAYINAVFLASDNTLYTDNASMSFTGGRMKVGLGSAGTLEDSWSTLDIISHEYAHAVTGSSAELVYQGESGALNESFSDIFGEMSEYYTLGSCDYLEAAARAVGPIRSLLDPNAHNDPDTYMGTFWRDTSSNSDNGGVHANSGVQNYWFYLLAEGGSGINDNGDAFSVSGIGKVAARSIAYKSLISYLTPNDVYFDAREASISAAQDLYGTCSNEEIQTRNAWHAVGLGSGVEFDPGLCGTIWSGTYGGVHTILAADTCTNTVIPLFGDVIYQAGQSVTLKEGFTATESGTRSFRVFIDPYDPCNP